MLDWMGLNALCECSCNARHVQWEMAEQHFFIYARDNIMGSEEEFRCISFSSEHIRNNWDITREIFSTNETVCCPTSMEFSDDSRNAFCTKRNVKCQDGHKWEDGACRLQKCDDGQELYEDECRGIIRDEMGAWLNEFPMR